MSLFRPLITLATATAVALGATAVPTATAQTYPRTWEIADISDSTTEGSDWLGWTTMPGASLTFTNTSKYEVNCFLTAGPAEYVEPIFTPWTQEGISYSEASHQSSLASSNLSRVASKQPSGYKTSDIVTYIAAGETIEFKPLFQLQPGWGVYVECVSEPSSLPPGEYLSTVLVGYADVLDDYSIKSPTSVNTTEAPVTTTEVTTEPTTEVTPEPSTEVTTEPAPATTTSVEPSTTAAPTTSAAPTTTSVAPTTSEQPVPSDDAGNSSSSPFGWIIVVLLGLGLAGIAGFLAQNYLGIRI